MTKISNNKPVYDVRKLKSFWSFGFGIWDLFGIWCLEPGISYIRSVGETTGIQKTGLGQEFLKKIVPLVVHDDKGRKILDPDPEDSLHTKFGIFQRFHPGDAFLCESGGRPPDRPQVKTAMFPAGLRYGFRAIPLGQHNEWAAVGLEKRHIWIHTPCRCRPEWSRRISGRGFGGSGIIDDVFLEIIGQIFPALQPFIKFGVRDIPGDNYFAAERKACGNRIFYWITYCKK